MSIEPLITDWHGCYDEGWKGAGCLSQESFAHPAKFAFGLVVRIVRHGIDRGYWKASDTIGDPFGGVACGGIVCGYHGLNWVGVELEPRFVECGNANLAMHGPRWLAAEQTNRVTLLQGDSRRFAEIVGQHLAGAVTSPPYADSDQNYASGWKYIDPTKAVHTRFSKQREAEYGSEPGQIGALPAGSLDATITSPPYVDSINDRNGIDHSKFQSGTRYGPNSQANMQGYGQTDGQIGAIRSAGDLDAAISSPPFTIDQPCASQSQAKKDYHAFTRGDGTKRDQNMVSDGNIQQLPHGDLDGAVTSPPFEDQEPSHGQRGSFVPPKQKGRGFVESGETYWSAMALVYRQMWLALRPGAVCAIVLKDYVSKGQRVPLCDQTCRLLESCGFDVFERSRCWLVKETREPSLFGGEHVTTKQRKSFFRRLAEKNGSPRIDWEEVVWCKRIVP